MAKYCLDTYTLWEIILGNPKFSFLMNEPFVITDWTLIELYKTMLREFDKDASRKWYEKFKSCCATVDISLVLNALDFQHQNKKENLSIFDCVGYFYSLENDLEFGTGDKECRNKEGDLFLQQ